MPRKTVLVTGASRGIGKAIAIKYAKKGYNVIITCVHRRDQLLLTEVEIENYNVECMTWVGDAGDYNSCEELFKQIKKQFGGLDVLVNNAGISYIGLFQDMKPEDWELMIRTNLTSVFNCCRLAVPMMLQKQQGKIVNISSVWGISGASCEGRSQCLYQGACQGTGSQQYPGQCHRLRRHRHGDEPLPAPGRLNRADGRHSGGTTG